MILRATKPLELNGKRVGAGETFAVKNQAAADAMVAAKLAKPDKA